MGKAMFYHLTRRPLEDTLPMLLERSLAQGWRVAVRGTTPERIEWLDQKLWLGADDGFLPHGLATAAHSADQPILLTTSTDLPNAPDCIISIDGAEISESEIETHERACFMFDGSDEAATNVARNQWRVVSSAGAEAEYWSEEGGSWACKHRTNAPDGG